MTTAAYYIRQLGIRDKEVYKNIRLEALQTEPAVFCSTYKREAAFREEEWLTRLNGSNSAAFGLYYDNSLIGITGVVISRPGEGTFVASYIRKEHRGRGLSAMLYQARLDWAQVRNLEHIIVSHRKSNLASRAANQRFGFRYTHEEMMTWPDGIEEANVYYCLDLLK
jgi:RimJ/RimL family protein N-acetyltransferase